MRVHVIHTVGSYFNFRVHSFRSTKSIIYESFLEKCNNNSNKCHQNRCKSLLFACGCSDVYTRVYAQYMCTYRVRSTHEYYNGHRSDQIWHLQYLLLLSLLFVMDFGTRPTWTSIPRKSDRTGLTWSRSDRTKTGLII